MSKPPRIAHLVSPISWRGGEQQAVNVYEELDKLGVYQVFICPKGSITEAYCKEHDFRYYAFKKRLALDLGFANNLSRVCKDEQIDILHPHDSGAHTLCILSIDLFKNPSQVLLQRRVDFPVSKSMFSRYKYNHPRIKKILCVSNAIKEILRPDIRRPEIMQVVYEGIDASKFVLPAGNILREEFQIKRSTPIIANVAALAPQKDYFTFIDTVKILVDEGIDAAFMAFGSGPQEAEIMTYAKETGMDKHIFFAGFRTDIPEILPEIDLLLFSSETEGLGTTILDCYAAEVPIVSTNAGGIPELIIHKKTGYLGKVKDPKSLAAGVKLALQNPKEKQAWVDGGKERLRLFTRDITAKNTLAAYQEIIASEKN